MTTPLILQIQEAALDSNSSVTDALRKAKIACAKLNLKEFGDWIELELNGYANIPPAELPHYRKLHGIPQGYNPFHGWQPIRFYDSEQQELWGSAPIGMTISAIEESLREAKNGGSLGLPYAAELETLLSNGLNLKNVRIRIMLTVAQATDILHAVRNILLEWTIEMEKQGILGENLMFSPEDKKKSEAVTAQTINHFNIGQVGSLVQHAEHSVVQGGIDSTIISPHGTLEFVKQVEALLPVSNLPGHIQEETVAALNELKQEAGAANPESRRLRKGLESIKRVLAPASETALKIVVDTLVTKLLNPH